MSEASLSDHLPRDRSRRSALRLGVRLVMVVGLAVAIGFALRQVGRRLEQREGTAGFGQGFFQGASMPLAFPTLILGVDVTIYATHNNGVPYKLGYILGITACGACFFGAIYGRVARWRARS